MAIPGFMSSWCKSVPARHGMDTSSSGPDSKTLKTLLISEIFPPQTGGSGRWFYEIYRRMPSDQYLIAAGQHPREADFDQSHDLQVIRLPLQMQQWGLRSFSGSWGYWSAVRRLNRIVREHSIQRVHAARCLPEGVMALALCLWKRLPYCCYVHGEDVNMAAQSREHTLLVRQVLHRAQSVLANSQNTANILRKNWDLPESKITVLYPGVDVQRFVPSSRDTELRHRLGWADRPVILTVGRLQQRKGQDQLIRTLLRVRESVPNVLYVIVGDGEDRTRLSALVDELGLHSHVQFRGETSETELASCYQQCDLFVLPNREINGDIEGFGMVLLEAQACAKPVIAGASGGTRETMQVSRTGRIVDCESEEALATTVIELLSDEDRRTEMGRSGRRWVEDKFSWESLSAEAARLFGTECNSQALQRMTPARVV